MKERAFIAATLGILFDAMDASIYFMVLHPALSDILKTTSDTEIGYYGSLILCIFMVGWGIGSLVFGILADRIGRARTMVMTILLYAVCTGLCATATDWMQLAFYRFLVGVGIGAEISIGAVMLSEFFEGKHRILASCLMEAGFCLGYLATSLANLSVGNVSWRLMFLIGILPALLALYIRMRLSEPENFKEVQYEREKARKLRAMGHRVESNRALTSPMAVLFSREYLRTTLVVTTLAGVAIVGYWAAVSWIPAWINQLTGNLAVAERSTAGIVLNVSGLIACVATFPMIKLLGRINTLKVSYLFSLIATVGMFVLVKSYGPDLLGWIFAVGFFTSIPFVVMVVVIPELFATELLGSASGLAFSAGRLAAAAAALGSAQVIATFGGSYAAAGAVVGLVYAVGFLASYMMPVTTGEVLGPLSRTRRIETESPPLPVPS